MTLDSSVNSRDISTSLSTIQVSDGTEMGVFLATPKSVVNAPTLLVLPEAFGVNEHIQDVCGRFAAQGFVAAAPELYHRTAPKNFTAPYADFAKVVPHYQAMTNEGLALDLRATHAFLNQQKGVNSEQALAIGFCLGGRAAFLANAILPLKGSVSFYGGRIAPDFLDRAKDIQAPQMLLWGGQDPHIGDDQIQAVVAALKANSKNYVNVVFGPADHGFFCDARPQYHADSARQAWALTLEFMRNCLARG